MSTDAYERVLLVKQQVFVYRIPPLGSNRGYKAADWKLDNPDWTGRLKVVSKGKLVEIRLEDKTGELFAKAPIEKYPGVDIESVADSSRYFVIRLKDDSGRSAFIGIGFADRSDSFDLNVTLQDHFKDLEKETKWRDDETKEATAPSPKLDLGFKEGQTIKINIGGVKSEGVARPRASPSANIAGGFVPLLPPPPASGAKIAPPPSSHSRSSPSVPSQNQFRDDKFVPSLLGGFSEAPAAPPTSHSNPFGSAPKNPFLQETAGANAKGLQSTPPPAVIVDNLLDL